MIGFFFLTAVGLQAADASLSLREKIKKEKAHMISITLANGKTIEMSSWQLKANYNAILALVEMGSEFVSQYDENYMKVLLRYGGSKNVIIKKAEEVMNSSNQFLLNNEACENYTFLSSLVIERTDSGVYLKDSIHMQ